MSLPSMPEGSEEQSGGASHSTIAELEHFYLSPRAEQQGDEASSFTGSPSGASGSDSDSTLGPGSIPAPINVDNEGVADPDDREGSDTQRARAKGPVARASRVASRDRVEEVPVSALTSAITETSNHRMMHMLRRSLRGIVYFGISFIYGFWDSVLAVLC